MTFNPSFLSCILALSLALFVSCSNTVSHSSGESTEETHTEVIEENESVEVEVSAVSELDQARNVMTHTMSIFTGTFFVAFNSLAAEFMTTLGDAFVEVFDAEGDLEKLDELDAAIAEMDAESKAALDELMIKVDEVFDQLKDEDPALYEKIFSHEAMAEGVSIVRRYDLPAGFVPLTESLDSDEEMRYILYLSADIKGKDDQTDPVHLLFADLMQWMETLDGAFENDPEIKAFFGSMRGK